MACSMITHMLGRKGGWSIFNFMKPLSKIYEAKATQILSNANQTSRSMILQSMFSSTSKCANNRSLLNVNDLSKTFSRTVTKFSLKTGRKNSVSTVLDRFYRLDTGLWIRRRGGYHRKMYKKSEKAKWHYQQHVFCTKTQSVMLDHMVTDFWKKKKFYIDDPFEPYQVRNNFDWVSARRKS